MDYRKKMFLRKLWISFQFIVLFGAILYGVSKYNILSKIKKYAKQNQELRKEIVLPSKSIDELTRIEAQYGEVIDKEIHNADIRGKIERIIAIKYFKKKVWHEVVKHLERANKVIKLGYEDYYRLAVAYANLGWNEADTKKKQKYFTYARTYYEKSLSLNPGYAKSIYGLSLLEFFIFGEKKKAISRLSSVIDNKNIKNTALAIRIRLALAKMLYLVGKYKLAKYHYEVLLSEIPKGDYLRSVCITNIHKIEEILYGRR